MLCRPLNSKTNESCVCVVCIIHPNLIVIAAAYSLQSTYIKHLKLEETVSHITCTLHFKP